MKFLNGCAPQVDKISCLNDLRKSSMAPSTPACVVPAQRIILQTNWILVMTSLGFSDSWNFLSLNPSTPPSHRPTPTATLFTAKDCTHGEHLAITACGVPDQETKL